MQNNILPPTMIENSTYNEVSKSQQIRLIDVFFLGPFMIYLAYKYRMKPLEKYTLAFFGASTVYYNAKNYLKNEKISKGI